MADTDEVWLYLGIYYSEQEAVDDGGVVWDRYLAGAIGPYEAVVISRGEDGHVSLVDQEGRAAPSSQRDIELHAVVELIFPPSIIGIDVDDEPNVLSARELSGAYSELREFAELLDNGQSGLLVIGDSTLSCALHRADLWAVRHIAKSIELSRCEQERVASVRLTDRTRIGWTSGTKWAWNT